MSARFLTRESLRTLAQWEGSLLGALDGVIPSLSWSREELRAHQENKMRALLQHAFGNVALYKNKFAAASFHPEDFRTLDDLPRIPFLTKDDLRSTPLDELVSARHRANARLIASSGSTGVPSRLFRDESSLWHFTARNTALYHDWCGEKPIANVLYFVDMAQDSIDYALADLLRTTVMQNRIVSVHDSVKSQLEKLDEFTPEFISSYPSTMRNLAIALHRRGEKNNALRLLHLTSETLDAGTRRLIEIVFPNARLIETYTCSEAGLVAFECTKDKRLHIAEDGVIAEIIEGELAVTDLTNWSTPVIRYRGLGDRCRWDSSPCPCGSPLRSIRQLEGRVADSIIRRDGTMISPLVITNALDEITGVYQYQIVQREAGRFEIAVVKDETSECEEASIRDEVACVIERAVGEPSATLVNFVAAIHPKTGAHKIPLVISFANVTS
ncbi:MAG: hypothetical protein WCN98_10430 [Verrucomicrobiaceae bacterium]